MSYLKAGFSVYGPTDFVVKSRAKGYFGVNSSYQTLQFKESEFWNKTLDVLDQKPISKFIIKSPNVDHPPNAQKSSIRWWEKSIDMNMIEIQSAQQLVDSLLNAGNRLVVLDFYSPGCGGCKTLHPKGNHPVNIGMAEFDLSTWRSLICQSDVSPLTIDYLTKMLKKLLDYFQYLKVSKTEIKIRICQIAEMNPSSIFLKINYEQHKSLCYALNVHVLPFFRFYRGEDGRVCSFSCTNATIKKFKDALAKHGSNLGRVGPAKGLDESELSALESMGLVTRNLGKGDEMEDLVIRETPLVIA